MTTSISADRGGQLLTKYFVSKCKTWRLKEAEIQREYEEEVHDRENKIREIEMRRMLRKSGRSLKIAC